MTKAISLLLLLACLVTPAQSQPTPSAPDFGQRMAWWRDARFGMFIHWGVYSVPAGEWNGESKYGEWIRENAQIPLETYGSFLDEFNPTGFDAEAWARMAQEAGMKYLVITSKHHDGFCLWPSELTDYDIDSTPFKRDILGELKAACDNHGIVFCLYHSIMDWHHPDYLPRRKWEHDRPTDDAEFDRYVAYLKGQLKELVERYDPGVLWFDGEWESTWTHELGVALDDYVRGLNPKIIVNNRVDKGRQGMHGMTRQGGFRGDFGTPEQKIPATGVPGVDWESCMTMNEHWGFNKQDTNYKSTRDLVRKLIDIVSKGGNFLLNVGPMATGEFPPESVERLAGIGSWMNDNQASIYGAHASPCEAPSWGRITSKGDLLYLHVFDWPSNGELIVPIQAEVSRCGLLAQPDRQFQTTSTGSGVVVHLAGNADNHIATVLELQCEGETKPIVRQ